MSSRLSTLLAYDPLEYTLVIFFFFLCFCSISCYFSFFVSYFVYLGSLFFLGEPGHRFVDFVYPFKTLALGFIDFLNCFLYFIYLLSDFYYFLPPADFRFCLFFFYFF